MLRALALASVCLTTSASFAMSFNFNFDNDVPQYVRDSMNAAGNRWSTIFVDAITINYNVGVFTSNSGVLASAGSNSQTVTYDQFRNALIGDASNALDNAATGAMQTGSNLNIRTNYWSNGGGNSNPYNGSVGTIDINRANAKAIGLRGANNSGTDASINFNINFTFDPDPTNGINPGEYDLVGIATHEIGHALGFVSGVDTVDAINPGEFGDDDFAWVQPLDVFRFSANASIPDLTAGGTNSYFSIDNGATGSARRFSTGSQRGDGRQASHWKDNLGIGIMDPTSGAGELLAISQNDIDAMDVIGYTRAVPEPATMIALGAGVLALARRRRKNA